MIRLFAAVAVPPDIGEGLVRRQAGIERAARELRLACAGELREVRGIVKRRWEDCAGGLAEPLQVSGTLWGGNLAMLASLAGTPWMPQIQGGILFLEDVNEHPYRVERSLLQLHQAGVLDAQKAVLLGDFSGYRLSDYDNGYDFESMLSFIRSQVTVPLLQGLQFGHVRDKLTLPVGAMASLRSDAEGFTLEVSGYPLPR